MNTCGKRTRYWYLQVDSGNVRVGVVLFGDDATILFDLNDYTTRESMINFLNTVTYPRGRTVTEEAFE